MNSGDPARRSIRFGWTALAVFALLGLGLELLHLIKAPVYMEMRIRRELWILAHAHGVLLALINIVFGMFATRIADAPRLLVRAGRALRFGALAIPLGFLFGGIGNAETDPSIAIVLVPVGAVVVLYALVVSARYAHRYTVDTQPQDRSEQRAGQRKKKRRGN